MGRYWQLIGTLAALCALALMMPLPASAGCPGCEEYNLDLPDDGGDPAPAPAPVPAAPVPAAPTTEVPAPVAPVAPVEVEKPAKPADTDADPVPNGKAVKPPDLASVPAVAASQASKTGSSDGAGAGVLPLAIAMAVVALVGGFLGARRQRSADGS